MPPLRSLLQILFAATLLCTGCASDEERLAEHLARADAYLESGSTRAAMIELRAALKLQPQSGEINERIAHVLQSDGAFADAVFFLREAQRLGPRRVEPVLAEIPLVVGTDLERAKHLVERALELDPKHAGVHQRRAELALIENDTAAALDAAFAAVELAPEEPRPHQTLGVVYQALIREHRLSQQTAPPDELFEKALAAFGRAAEDPKAIEPLIERARTLGSWPGHEAEATAAFRSAVERALATGRPATQLLTAEAALERARAVGDAGLERWCLETIVALDPDALTAEKGLSENVQERWLGAVLALVRLEEADQPGAGQARLTELLERRAGDVSVHLLFARFLHGEGRTSEAIDQLEKAAAEQPALAPELLDTAVGLALASGQLERARELGDRLASGYADHARSLLARARLARAEGRLGDAAELLGRVNGIDESAESQRLLAQTEMQRGNRQLALQAAGRARLLAPGNAEVQRLEAKLHHDAGDWPAVLDSVRRLAESGQLTPDDELLGVRPLYELGRTAQGRAVLDRLLATGPPPPELAIAFARNEGSRDPERAAEVVSAALERTPTHPQLVALATAFDLRAGRVEPALARLDAALAREAAPLLLLVRADTLAGAERFAEAERDARHALELDPELPGALERLLGLYRAQGKLDEAVAELEASESAGLLGARNRALLGQLHMSRGNRERAQDLYEAALREDPSLIAPKNDLAFLLASRGEDLDRALRLAQEAMQQRGDDPNVADTLGYVFLRRGLAAPAAEHLGFAVRRAEELGTLRASHVYHLGLALQALGRHSEAAELFARALELEPGFPDAEAAQRELAQARASAGEAASATP